MSSFKAIKEQIYSILDGISTANGAYYNWSTIRREDTFVKDSADVVATIRYPNDSPFVQNGEGEITPTNINRIMMRSIEIVCLLKSKTSLIQVENIVDEDNDALDEAVDDVLCALSSDSLNSCSLGVKAVEFIGATKEEIDSSDIYYPYNLVVEFNIYYNKARC